MLLERASVARAGLSHSPSCVSIGKWSVPFHLAAVHTHADVVFTVDLDRPYVYGELCSHGTKIFPFVVGDNLLPR